MRSCAMSLGLLFLSLPLSSLTLEFEHEPGSRQRIEARIHGAQFVNGALPAEYDQEYRTVRTVTAVDDDGAEISDLSYFNITNVLAGRQTLGVSDFLEIRYRRDGRGRLTIDSDTRVPTKHSAPAFPDGSVSPGDRWTHPATEVQDLFGDGELSRFPIDVDYVFTGYEERDGRELARIEYSFDFDLTRSSKGELHRRIERVVGSSETVLLFDFEAGTPLREEYARDYAVLVAGDVYRFVDCGTRIWHPVETLDRDGIVDELRREIREREIPDTTVEEDERGVRLTLSGILFEPDSTRFLPEVEERLEELAPILERYHEYPILLVGHTTDRGTREGRQSLALARAQAVAEHFIRDGALDSEKLTLACRVSWRTGAHPVPPAQPCYTLRS